MKTTIQTAQFRDPKEAAIYVRVSAASARLSDPPGMLLSAAQRAARFRAVLQSALAVVLTDNGWEFAAQAGELVFTKDGLDLNLSEELKALESGKTDRETWQDRWRNLGLADLSLVSASADRT